MRSVRGRLSERFVSFFMFSLAFLSFRVNRDHGSTVEMQGKPGKHENTSKTGPKVFAKTPAATSYKVPEDKHFRAVSANTVIGRTSRDSPLREASGTRKDTT